VVTRVGSAVREFQVGDGVYARPRDLRIGIFAEYIAIDQDDLAAKPASLTLHEAAAVPLVSLAAWQALVDRAHVKPGQNVLVHAGSGGLGSTVIQLAKHLGATVATTASKKNADLVRSLGADVVVDYTKEDFAEVTTLARGALPAISWAAEPAAGCNSVNAEKSTGFVMSTTTLPSS
jgi:NADPH:quinone reductase-like Zn-dependent oxidoreductase